MSHSPHDVQVAGVLRGQTLRRTVSPISPQDVVLVCDVSPSMATENKAADAAAAAKDLVRELAQPVNRDGFRVAVVHFDSSAKVASDLTKATALAQTHLPALELGDGTNVTAGLVAVRDLLDRAGASTSGAPPVCVVFSDGQANVGGSPTAIADELRAHGVVIVAIALGSDADEGLLQRVASPGCFTRCRTGTELRRFFAEVGRTMTRQRTAPGRAVQTALAQQIVRSGS